MLLNLSDCNDASVINFQHLVIYSYFLNWYRLIDGLFDENRGPEVRRLRAQIIFFYECVKFKMIVFTNVLSFKYWTYFAEWLESYYQRKYSEQNVKYLQTVNCITETDFSSCTTLELMRLCGPHPKQVFALPSFYAGKLSWK